MQVNQDGKRITVSSGKAIFLAITRESLPPIETIGCGFSIKGAGIDPGSNSALETLCMGRFRQSIKKALTDVKVVTALLARNHDSK